jgi:hypothetical protein
MAEWCVARVEIDATRVDCAAANQSSKSAELDCERTQQLPIRHDGKRENNLTLCPVIDMINHSPGRTTKPDPRLSSLRRGKSILEIS